jgi:hypothetical protein
MIHGAFNLPQRAVEGAAQDVQHFGDNQPMAAVGPATDAAMLMMGGGGLGAEESALGAAGGRLKATRNPLTGKLQVAPQQKLTDLFVQGGPPAEITPREALRAKTGRFATTADYYRQRVPTADELTSVPTNQMYNAGNMPGPVTSHMETPNPADPALLENNLSKMPNSFGAPPAVPADVLKILRGY